jgi:hypothetical protein
MVTVVRSRENIELMRGDLERGGFLQMIEERKDSWELGSEGSSGSVISSSVDSSGISVSVISSSMDSSSMGRDSWELGWSMVKDMVVEKKKWSSSSGDEKGEICAIIERRW